MAETKLQSRSSDKMLLLKDKISEELNQYGDTGQGSPLGNPSRGSPLYATFGSPATVWIGTLPVYNEDGKVVGYIPLCDSSDMT